VKLRPVERVVLRLFDQGLTKSEVASKFLRSNEWVEQVSKLAHYKLDRALINGGSCGGTEYPED
jgi:DNA-binding NarL/FixJ family response regulator